MKKQETQNSIKGKTKESTKGNTKKITKGNTKKITKGIEKEITQEAIKGKTNLLERHLQNILAERFAQADEKLIADAIKTMLYNEEQEKILH